jgi:hypothetical protein
MNEMDETSYAPVPMEQTMPVATGTPVRAIPTPLDAGQTSTAAELNSADVAAPTLTAPDESPVLTGLLPAAGHGPYHAAFSPSPDEPPVLTGLLPTAGHGPYQAAFFPSPDEPPVLTGLLPTAGHGPYQAAFSPSPRVLMNRPY